MVGESPISLSRSCNRSGLSAANKEIKAICDESQKEINKRLDAFKEYQARASAGPQEMFEVIFSSQDACMKKTLAILTAEQRTQYDKLRGRAFDFSLCKDFDAWRHREIQRTGVGATAVSL